MLHACLGVLFACSAWSGCSKEPAADSKPGAGESPPLPSPSVQSVPSAVGASPSSPPSPNTPSPSAPPEGESTPALDVCKKLAASGAVSDCRISGNSARFGDASGGGVVSVFDDAKSFDVVSKSLSKDTSSKLATSRKARVVVSWNASSSADFDKKLRDAVAAL